MSDLALELKGIDELISDLQSLEKSLPGEATVSLRKLANRFCVDVRHAAPSKYKSTVAAKFWKKHLRTELTMKNGYVARIDIVNASNLHHLLENGHKQLDAKGNIVGKGFVPGAHYTEKTRLQWSNNGQMEQELDKIIQRSMRKHNL